MKRAKKLLTIIVGIIAINCFVAFSFVENQSLTPTVIRVHCCLHAENWGAGPYGIDCISCTLLQFENPYAWATCPMHEPE
ncbi:MAG: hypothetical protein RQ743_13795 [Bacteroidales bacterium]|nr:hypothetical protein [Bacteroidales bacterium]